MLTAIVTKRSVTNPQPKVFIIVFNLSVNEETVIVINQDFSCEYRPGESIASKVDEVKDKMQFVIDNYKASQVIFDNVQLDSAVTTIQGGLIL